MGDHNLSPDVGIADPVLALVCLVLVGFVIVLWRVNIWYKRDLADEAARGGPEEDHPAFRWIVEDSANDKQR